MNLTSVARRIERLSANSSTSSQARSAQTISETQAMFPYKTIMLLTVGEVSYETMAL
jgi:hypothetical protein